MFVALALLVLPGCQSCHGTERGRTTKADKTRVNTAAAGARTAVERSIVATTQAAERTKEHLHDATEGVQDMTEKHADPEIAERIQPHLVEAEKQQDKIIEVQAAAAKEVPAEIVKVEKAGEAEIDRLSKRVTQLEDENSEFNRKLKQDNAKRLALFAFALMVTAVVTVIGSVVLAQYLGGWVAKAGGIGAAMAGVCAILCFAYAENAWWLNVLGAVIIGAILLAIGWVAVRSILGMKDLVGRIEDTVKPTLAAKAPELKEELFGNNVPVGLANRKVGELAGTLKDSTQGIIASIRGKKKQPRKAAA